MNYLFIACMFFIVLLIVAIYVNRPTAVIPPLAFNALSGGYGSNVETLTLTEVHTGDIQLPRILPRQLENISTKRKNVVIQLPAPNNPVTLLQPTTRVDKSALLKLDSTHRFRVGGMLYDNIYMWRVPGEGDLVCVHGQTEYGESVWDVSCTGQNLQTSPSWYNTLGNVGKSIKDCMGAAKGLYPIPTVAGIPDAISCAQDIWNDFACLFGDTSACPKSGPAPPPPLTNADIQNDMQYVLQQQTEAATAGQLVTSLQMLQHGTLSWDQYINKLSGPSNQAGGYSAKYEYGTSWTSGGQSTLGDPDLILSNSSWNADLVRTYLAGVTDGTNCATLTTPLCQMVNTISGMFNTVVTSLAASNWNPDTNSGGEPGKLFYQSLWPMMLSTLQRYVIVMQEVAQRTALRDNGTGEYVAPWKLLMSAGNPMLQSQLQTLLPTVYTLYTMYVQNYQNNFVWDTISTSAANWLPGSNNQLWYNNYCGLVGCSYVYDDGSCEVVFHAGRGSANAQTFYSLINTNFNTVSQSILDVGYTYSSNPNGVPSGWEWPSGPAYGTFSFPGFAFQIPSLVPGQPPSTITSANAVVDSTDSTGGLYCQSSKDDAQRTFIVNSYTQWFHKYNGDPYDTLDMIASMVALTCTQQGTSTLFSCATVSAPSVLGITGNAFTFGVSNNSVTLENSANLMCSSKFPITLDYTNKTASGGGPNPLYPSYTNGYSFDTSLQSSSGFFSLSDIMCCPTNTTMAEGCWTGLANVSVGNEVSPSLHSRTIYCVIPYDLGNNGTTSALLPAQVCIPSLPPSSQVVIPVAYPTTVAPLSTVTSIINSTLSVVLPIAQINGNVFVEKGFPLEFSVECNPASPVYLTLWPPDPATYYSNVYDASTGFANLAPPPGILIPISSTCTRPGPICNANGNFIQADRDANVTPDYSTIPQMLAYNFATNVSMAVTPIPSVITVTDGTVFVTITKNDALLASYTVGSVDPINGPYTGLCTDTVCPTGMTFNVYSDAAMTNQITAFSGPAYFKVLEFVTSVVGESTRSTAQCDTNSIFCRECPLNSAFESFDWTGYSGATYPESTPSKWSLKW